MAPTTHVDVTHTPHTEFRPRQPRAHVSARRTAERIEGTRFFSSSPLSPFLLLALFDLSNRGSVCLAVGGRGGGGWVRSDRSGTGRISGRAIRVESRASFDALSLTRVLIAGKGGGGWRVSSERGPRAFPLRGGIRWTRESWVDRCSVVFFAVVGRFATEFVTVRVVKGKEQSESKTRLVATVSRWLTFLRTRAFN